MALNGWKPSGGVGWRDGYTAILWLAGEAERMSPWIINRWSLETGVFTVESKLSRRAYPHITTSHAVSRTSPALSRMRTRWFALGL